MLQSKLTRYCFQDDLQIHRRSCCFLKTLNDKQLNDKVGLSLIVAYLNIGTYLHIDTYENLFVQE